MTQTESYFNKETNTVDTNYRMKGISIRQPWANLIMQGNKDIEIRRLGLKFRGELLIHTGKTIDEDAAKRFKMHCKPIGKFIGIAELVKAVKYTNSNQFNKDSVRHLNSPDQWPAEWGHCWGYIIYNARPIKYIIMGGKPGIFHTGIERKDVVVKESLFL